MSFSYSPTALATSKVSQVRLLSGDTLQGAGIRPNGGNWQDEEIVYALQSSDQEARPAAAFLLRATAMEWASKPDSWSADGVSESYTDKANRYNALAAQVESAADSTGTASNGDLQVSLFGEELE